MVTAARRSPLLILPLQEHTQNQENPHKKAGGKPIGPILGYFISTTAVIRISSTTAMATTMPPAPGQGGTEGDTCLHFVSWVIGPAVQGQL